MELLMILTYAAICYAIFKIFRLPLNKWTVPTAVLGGMGACGLESRDRGVNPVDLRVVGQSRLLGACLCA